MPNFIDLKDLTKDQLINLISLSLLSKKAGYGTDSHMSLKSILSLKPQDHKQI